MRQLSVGLGLVFLACAGCQREPAYKEYSEAPAADVAAAPAASVIPPPPGTSVALHTAEPADAATEADAATTVRIAGGPPMLAYSYQYSLSLPHGRVHGLRARHERACVQAGYRVCQVVSTATADEPNGAVNDELVFRAAPAWLRAFRSGLDGEAKGAGGKVDTSRVSSEDLSREIVDTAAQLKAKTTLRDRLQGLLADRPGRLADLLSVERELARVQGEIDSATSQLSVMQARVAMSDVTVEYRSNDILGSSVRSPLSAAVKGVLANMAASLAAIIDLAAMAAPWAALLGGLAWLFRKRLPKLRWPFRRKTSAA